MRPYISWPQQYISTAHKICDIDVTDVTLMYINVKLKLHIRYIYLTSPLAKAKGNVWQGQPNNVTDVTLM